jgi:hypothetical protein
VEPGQSTKEHPECPHGSSPGSPQSSLDESSNPLGNEGLDASGESSGPLGADCEPAPEPEPEPTPDPEPEPPVRTLLDLWDWLKQLWGR